MQKKLWIGSLCVGLYAFSAMAVVKVGLVLDKGGKDDRSFNQAAYEGAVRAQKKWNMPLKAVEATDNNAFEVLYRNFLKRKYSLIIGVGFAQEKALQKTAKKYKQAHFAIVDSVVNLPNVRSLLFEEHEGSFLVGVIAALKSKTGKIGFIGGMDIPLIRRFELGFRAGAKYVRASVKIFSNYVGVTGTAWNDPPRAKELALAQYEKGADVIYAAAGASNLGLFDAAEEKKKFAIGVDSNQNWIKPGYILTSMMKRVDIAVYDTIRVEKRQKWQGGVIRYGLKNQGIDFALDRYNRKLLETLPEISLPAYKKKTILEVAQSIKKKLIEGKITVPDYYKTKKMTY